MLKKLQGAAHLFDRKIGLGRLGLALSLAIIVIAVVVLYHTLRDLDFEELVDAIEATDWRTLGIAALFVAAAYFSLTFYDLFALRTIGRGEIPYSTAALASSRATRSATMSAPACFPAAPCATASTPPGG